MITNFDMYTKELTNQEVNFVAPRLLKIIHLLRTNGDITRLVATGLGYYRTM